MARRTSLACIALLLVAGEAHAAGVDGLRASARDALKRGDPAQAVADLRRARASILAAERERELRVEVAAAEGAWFTSLVEAAKKLATEPRVRELLAIRREARRVESATGLSAAESALEASLLEVWAARDPRLDDAATLRLLARLTETLERPSSLDPIAAGYKAKVRAKIDAFSLAGADGDYVRERLAYYYRIRDAAPADPHPAAWSMRPASWPTGTCGAPLDAIRQTFERKTGTPVEVSVERAQCNVAQTFGAGSKVVRWEETIKVPKTERVVNRSRVTQRVPTENRQCFASYTTTTRQPRADGRPGYQQNYMQDGERCVSTSGYREEEVLVENIEYKTHTETEIRQQSMEVPTRTRHSTLTYAIAAHVRVDADDSAFTIEDKIEVDEVEYTNPHGAGSTFSASVRTTLDPAFVEKSRASLEALVLRSVRRSRVNDLRAALDTETDLTRRDARLAEIAALEAAGPPELVERLGAKTQLPAPAISAALLGARRDTDPPFTDLGGAPRAWGLPPPNPAAARDAFADEDRSIIKERGLETSGGIALGAGVLARGSGAAFPYGLLALRVQYVPAFLLFRTATGGIFFEAAGGIGDVLPVRGNVGLAGGVHVGPLTLLAEGAGGGDAVFFQRDEGQLRSSNEPDVAGSPLLGYGGRATVRAGDVGMFVSARRNHRFLGLYERSNVIDGALSYTVFQLGARYESFADVFTEGNPPRAPWSLSFTVGLAFDIHAADAGEITNRSASRREPPTARISSAAY